MTSRPVPLLPPDRRDPAQARTHERDAAGRWTTATASTTPAAPLTGMRRRARRLLAATRRA